MNAARLDCFDCFFNEHYLAILAEVADSDPSAAVHRTRSAFASAYRFWSRVEDEDDPVGWVHRVIADDRRAVTGRRARGVPQDESGHRASVDPSAEHRRILSLARRQRAVARFAIGTSTLLALGGELFVAHR